MGYYEGVRAAHRRETDPEPNMPTLIPNTNPLWSITCENGDVYEERLSAQFIGWQREDLGDGNLWYVLSETGGFEENFVAGATEEEAQRAFSARASGATQDDSGWEEIELARITEIVDLDALALEEDALDAAETEADALMDRDQEVAALNSADGE